MAKDKKIRILHVEDNPIDAELIELALLRAGVNCEISLAATATECLAALDKATYDLVLSDSHGHDLSVENVIGLVRERLPDVPLLVVSGSFHDNDPERLKMQGATDCLLKDDLDVLASTIRRTLDAGNSTQD